MSTHDPDSAADLLSLASSVGLHGFTTPANRTSGAAASRSPVADGQARNDPDSADEVLALARAFGLKGFADVESKTVRSGTAGS